MKKHILGFLALSAMMTVTTSQVVAETQQPTSVLICRAHQCADASFSMTKGFLFNKIVQMFRNNTGKSVLMCEADPVSHVCLNEGINVPTEALLDEMTVSLDGFNLVDEKLIAGQSKMEVVFDYKIKANNTFPRCQLGVSQLEVNFLDQVEMVSQDVLCNITETGRTSLNATYSVDYIDFDYGFLGAYYTIGIGEAVRGEKNGYVLMRFTHKAPSETAPAVITEVTTENVSQTVHVKALPEILQQTIPTSPATPIISDLEPSTKPQPQKEEAAPTQKKEVKPAPVEKKEAVTGVENVKKLDPTIIKTTIVEKTVITPDGQRQVTPPETRTILNSGKETTVIQ